MIEEGIICQICGNTFRSKSILLQHQKTAKYCLALRVGKTSEAPRHTCDYCNKSFTRKTNYTRHLETCDAYNLNSEIEQTRDENKELKARIKILEVENAQQKLTINDLEKKLAFEKGKYEGAQNSKPMKITNNTTTNNGTIVKNVKNRLDKVLIQNIQPLSIRAKDNIDDYTYDVFLKGFDGLLKFIVNSATLKIKDGNGSDLIERNYVCTDSSRKQFYALEENKEMLKTWVLDNDKQALNNTLDLIKHRTGEYYSELESTFLPKPKKDLLSKQEQKYKQEQKNKARKIKESKCKARNIEYIGDTDNSEEEREMEYLSKCQEIDDVNIEAWGGSTGEEAYSNYLDKLNKLSDIRTGIACNYNEQPRKELVEQIVLNLKTMLHI